MRRRTLRRTLARAQPRRERGYRDQIAASCFTHAVTSGDVSLVLYDVTTLYFEAEKEDDLRKVGFSKERRVDPQIVVGLLVDRHGFPLEVGCFEGDHAETSTIVPIVKAFQTRHPAGRHGRGALGVAAAALMPVRRDGTGRIVTTAGVGYAVLWIAVIGGRIAFAYSATGRASRSVGEFSIAQQITGAAVWTAAFVLMALAMVLTRVAVTAAHARIISARRVAVA